MKLNIPEYMVEGLDGREPFALFGVECGEGWYELLQKLIDDITKCDTNKVTRIFQIKEKLGGLRFYVNSATDEIYNLIEKVEEDSYTICEICGAPGKLRTDGYHQTLCDKHYQSRRMGD